MKGISYVYYGNSPPPHRHSVKGHLPVNKSFSFSKCHVNLMNLNLSTRTVSGIGMYLKHAHAQFLLFLIEHQPFSVDYKLHNRYITFTCLCYEHIPFPEVWSACNSPFLLKLFVRTALIRPCERTPISMFKINLRKILRIIKYHRAINNKITCIFLRYVITVTVHTGSVSFKWNSYSWCIFHKFCDLFASLYSEAV